jgi:hypothetical protein
MSKLKKIQKLFPNIENDNDIVNYLEKVVPQVEKDYNCKISTFKNRNQEYLLGWSYSIEKKGSSVYKTGNGSKVSNMTSAILEAIKL